MFPSKVEDLAFCGNLKLKEFRWVFFFFLLFFFFYFQCIRSPDSALPTGGNVLRKISVINVVSFVVSHCEGSKREFIFLTCLA